MAALGTKGAPGSGKGLKDASGISETEGGLEAGDAGGQSRSGARIGGLEAPSGISEPKAGLEADRLIAYLKIRRRRHECAYLLEPKLLQCCAAALVVETDVAVVVVDVAAVVVV